MNFWTIFITGLFAGGLTCLAMQGGLLAAAAPTSVSVFLSSRLLAYTLLGLLLGWLGSVVTLSLSLKIIIQILISIFILGTALNMLQVHPIFRYFVLTPPKFLAKLVRQESRVQKWFSPGLLGLMTILLPCGATQAMMGYAVSTASPLTGAAVMFTFILGTTPLFILLGFVAKKLTTSLSASLTKVAAFLLIIMSIYSLDGALALTGKPITVSQLAKTAYCQITICGQVQGAAVAEASIYFTNSGYQTNPTNLFVKAGTEVKLKLINNTAGGCIQAFTIPSLRYQKIVPPGTTTEYVFTAPKEPGIVPFMCGMGMYRGEIKVI